MKKYMTQKIIFFTLLAAIIICLIAIIGVVTLSSQADSFTEFYILNENGQAADYPRDIKTGESVTLVLGVVNHERKPVDYKIVIKLDSMDIKSNNTGTLQNDHKWEQKISFSVDRIGDNQKVQFYLFADEANEPLLKDPLVLVVNVTGK